MATLSVLGIYAYTLGHDETVLRCENAGTVSRRLASSAIEFNFENEGSIPEKGTQFLGAPSIL